MARYGQAFRERAVARMLPPESAPVAELARELGVAVQTLERWRSDSLTRPARERAWSARARFEAVLATSAMDESARSAWCRVEELDVAGSDEGIDNEANQPGEIPSDPAIAIHSALCSTAAGSDLNTDTLAHQLPSSAHQQQILAG